MTIDQLPDYDKPISCADCYNTDNEFRHAQWLVDGVRCCFACLMRRLGDFLYAFM
jgi:hypothetical protein